MENPTKEEIIEAVTNRLNSIWYLSVSKDREAHEYAKEKALEAIESCFEPKKWPQPEDKVWSVSGDGVVYRTIWRSCDKSEVMGYWPTAEGAEAMRAAVKALESGNFVIRDAEEFSFVNLIGEVAANLIKAHKERYECLINSPKETP